MNDFEAHEGSYDHQHRKRLKEMKQLTKDPNAASKAERERKANEEAGLKTINLNLSGAGGASTKKKPVFKSTLQPQNAATLGQPAPNVDVERSGSNDVDAELEAAYDQDPSQAKTNGWLQDRYDPRFPSNGRRLNLDPRRALAVEANESWEAYAKRAVERLSRDGKVPAELVAV